MFDNTRPSCAGNPVKGYFVCDTCGQMILVNVISAHTWVEVERVEPTCTEDGYVKSVCSECNTERTVALTKKGHSLTVDEIEVDGANYRIIAFKTHCTVCGVSAELGKDGFDSLPHITYKTVYEEGKADKVENPFYKIVKIIEPATCTKEGSCIYSFVFNLDGTEEPVEFVGPMLKEPHEPADDGDVIEWTLKIKGVTYVYRGILCKNCNEIIEVIYKAEQE